MSHPFEYLKEQEFILYNQYDRDLSGKDGRYAIRVELPTIESFFGLPWDEGIKLIDGYGLPPEKQKFSHYMDDLELFKTPDKLQNLIDTMRTSLTEKAKGKPTSPTPDQLFDILEQNPHEYKEEIEFIMIQQKRSFQGYWCFIKGRPTYIDGDHYTYLTDADIANPFRDDGRPFYRDIDRRTWIFLKWAETTTDSYFRFEVQTRVNGVYTEKYFNKKQEAVRWARKNGAPFQVEEGDFYLDMKRRTVSGVVWATRRGQGKTYMLGHKGIKRVMRIKNGRFVIQARSYETARDDVYTEKVKMPFQSMRFWYKPTHQVQASDILFYPKNSAVLSGEVPPHNGRIFVRSSENTAVDGNRTHVYGNDESGKDESGQVLNDHNDTVKHMLSLAGEIIGLAMYFSTFGQFEKGGKAFFDLFMASIFHKSNELGRTPTGMVGLFNPAFDGYDDCIDEFGESIIEDPQVPYINLLGKRMERGAKSTLMIERDSLKESGNYILLNKEIRNNPFNIREAARKASATDTVDLEVVNKRIEFLEFDDEAPKPRYVNLEWVGGRRTIHEEVNGKLVDTGRIADVYIHTPEDEKKGRFKFYLSPPEECANRKVFDQFSGQWGPDPIFKHRNLIGSDPFAMDKKDTTGKVLSKGGGVGFYKRDLQVDPDDLQRHWWRSHRTMFTYNHRADTTEEYCDDMLKAAVFLSCPVSTERNVTRVIEFFRMWNCSGYLLHLTDPITGMPDPVPGVRTQGDTKQNLFSQVRDYAKYHGHREESLDLLEQIRDCETFDDLTDNDLVAALGVLLIGLGSMQIDRVEENDNFLDMSGEMMYVA